MGRAFIVSAVVNLERGADSVGEDRTRTSDAHMAYGLSSSTCCTDGGRGSTSSFIAPLHLLCQPPSRSFYSVAPGGGLDNSHGQQLAPSLQRRGVGAIARLVNK